MEAGGGAAQRVEVLERRLAEKRAALLVTQQQIAQLEQDLRNWQAGAEGEQRVAAELDGLAVHGWVVLHDVHWPGRPQANLDHVAVGPGGVVVLDAKNWSSDVTVRDGVLRCAGYRKTRECEAAARMAADVAALLQPEHRSAVRAGLCLVQQELAPVEAEAGAVVVGLSQLERWLTELPVRLQPAEVRAVVDHLRIQLGGPVSPSLLTSAAVPARGGPSEPADPPVTGRAGRPSDGPPSRRPAGRTRARRQTGSPVKVVLGLVVVAVMALWLHSLASPVDRLQSSLLPSPPAPAATASATPGG